MGRSTNESGFAFAMIASSTIRTDRCGSTGISETLVQIYALGTDSLETIFTEALPFNALGIVNAIKIRFTESCYIGLKIIQWFDIINLLHIHNICLINETEFFADFYFLDGQIKNICNKWNCLNRFCGFTKQRKEHGFKKGVNCVYIKPVCIRFSLVHNAAFLLSFICHLGKQEPGTGPRCRSCLFLGGYVCLGIFVYICMHEVTIQDTKHNGVIELYLVACDWRTWVGTISRRADAIVTRHFVLANRIPATRILQSSALVDV